MPNTPDHKAEMFQLAQERKRAGLPSWDRKISLKGIFHNESLTFEQRRDAIVKRLRDSGWVDASPRCLPELVDELADTEDADSFDAVWDEIYDIADGERVWIGTI